MHRTMNGRPEVARLAAGACLDEAAAVVAAVERFMRENARTPVRALEAACAPRTPPCQSAWQRAALLEGVAREPAAEPAPGSWASARVARTVTPGARTVTPGVRSVTQGARAVTPKKWAACQ
ncbi:MAG: hypothetical protein M3Y17_00085 [Actinomycetota bacterium]|nr:hypothetical protein [Actinomycetota bacterium]